MNVSALVLIIVGLVTLFAGFPIISHYTRHTRTIPGFNLGGINGSGQIPDLPGLPNLIDSDTPKDAYSRTGLDGHKYVLVFSDEFNSDGRTFYPGEDPFWEAADLHYWPTADLEWYDPSVSIGHLYAFVILMFLVVGYNDKGRQASDNHIDGGHSQPQLEIWYSSILVV